MIAIPAHVPDDEIALLQRVRDWSPCRTLEEISPHVLQEITAEQGIDFATALLFDRVVRSSTHGEFIEQFERIRGRPWAQQVSVDATVAVAPGAFYREFPQTGARGEVVLAEAARIGFRAELIPTDSVGTPDQNGRLICRWLDDRKGKPVILASLSKGGTDVKLAIRQRGADECFRSVVAWINVGGILYGSPMVSWILDRTVPVITYRLLFRWFRQRFQFLTSLERRTGGELDFDLKLPDHITMINVLGFPLRKHMSSRRARRWHRRIGKLGPNESVTLLHDALRLPGHLLPVWGVDHYLQDGWDAGGLIRGLLRHIAAEANLAAFTPSTILETPD